ISKAVDTDAVDADGTPIGYGPFTVDVACTLIGEPVYAQGFSADDPMTAELADGATVTFTHLPAGASCTVTETDTKGADSTTIVTVVDGADPVTTDGTEATVELAPDPVPYTGQEPATSAAVTNHFDVGSLQLTKDVVGEVADL